MAHRNFPAPRMAKDWFSLPAAAAGFSGSVTTLMSTLQIVQAQTVMRMIGEYIITATPGATLVDGDHVEVACAIGVVSGDAATAGSTSMPDPIGEPPYPWLYYMSHKFLFTDNDDGSSQAQSLRHSFDIRSQRKLKSNQALVFIAEYGDIVGAPLVTLSTGTVRVLMAH